MPLVIEALQLYLQADSGFFPSAIRILPEAGRSSIAQLLLERFLPHSNAQPESLS